MIPDLPIKGKFVTANILCVCVGGGGLHVHAFVE